MGKGCGQAINKTECAKCSSQKKKTRNTNGSQLYTIALVIKDL